MHENSRGYRFEFCSRTKTREAVKSDHATAQHYAIHRPPVIFGNYAFSDLISENRDILRIQGLL